MARSPDRLPLHWLFAHNAWATEQLLAFCENLSEQQLAATAPGAVGSVFETLHHVIQAEGGYLSRLAPELRPAHWQRYVAKDYASIRERARELEGLWNTYAAADPDAAAIRGVTWPDVRHEFPAGVEMAQAVSHSYGHREQVCTILTSLGLQPPDLSGLAWGDAMGVLRRLPVE
jgi:uncharacterized damage-inducible protein DinB